GIVGAILTGVFAVKEIGGTAGMLEGNSGQVVTQLIGVGATVAYGLVMTFIILKVIDVAIGLRVSEEEEREGLDVALHGEHVE
ncbi:MAG: ammonium transporter, partial [Gammaproteobacteria bacterium]|nr:ammonium transporter [Gammaproteobacteria bacterium]